MLNRKNNNFTAACNFIVEYMRKRRQPEIRIRVAYEVARSSRHSGLIWHNESSYQNFATRLRAHPALKRTRWGYVGLKRRPRSGARRDQVISPEQLPVAQHFTLIRKDKLRALKEEVRDGRRAIQRLERLERFLHRNFPQS